MNSERTRPLPNLSYGVFFGTVSYSDFKFRRQHQFGSYVADFYCREAQVVIECDGSVHEPNEQWLHDQNRDAYMIAQGLRVLRFKNEEILNDTEKVLDEIAGFLSSQSIRP
jgi:very-short-patch-repair endonuclease